MAKKDSKNATEHDAKPATTRHDSCSNDLLPPADTEQHFDPVKGEKALWQAVITQALMDARCESKKSEAAEYKRQAITWLRGTSQDFVFVCHSADLDPSYVRRKCQDALARGCVWRAGPAKMKLDA